MERLGASGGAGRAGNARPRSRAGRDASASAEVDYSSYERAEMNRFRGLTGRDSSPAAEVDYSSYERAEMNRFRTLRDLGRGGGSSPSSPTSNNDEASSSEGSANPLADQLRAFTASYMAIPVVVGSQVDGTPIVVNVQAPYAHNGTREDTWEDAKTRLDGNPVYRAMRQDDALGYAAWDSHATPSEMQRFLQESVELGLVGTTAAELREYLVAHNFTVDCSSFVSHALGDLGHAELDRGHSQNYKSGPGISAPDPLSIRTGDIMVRPKAETGIGHVRIVIDVETDGDTVRFSTGESTGWPDVTDSSSQGSGFGSVGVVWWQFSRSGGWETLQRSASGEGGPFQAFTASDVLRRLDGLDAAPERLT
jgi:cell wall-associated NlpC family hydrolase